MILKNKKAFLARTWMIAFIVGIAVISLAYFMVTGLATEYDNLDIIDEDFQTTYNKYSDLEGDVHSMFEESSSDEGLSVVGTFTTLFGATFTVIQLIFGSLLLPGAMLRQFAMDSGAPSLIANIIFTLPLVIVTITIVLVIISSVSRGRI